MNIDKVPILCPQAMQDEVSNYVSVYWGNHVVRNYERVGLRVNSSVVNFKNAVKRSVQEWNFDRDPVMYLGWEPGNTLDRLYSENGLETYCHPSVGLKMRIAFALVCERKFGFYVHLQTIEQLYQREANLDSKTIVPETAFEMFE